MKTGLQSVHGNAGRKWEAVCVHVSVRARIPASASKKDLKVKLEIDPLKSHRKEYLSIFSVLCHRLNIFFFPSSSPSPPS